LIDQLNIDKEFVKKLLNVQYQMMWDKNKQIKRHLIYN
jgi:hypothetical protein